MKQPAYLNAFQSEQETTQANEFLKQGYIIVDIADKDALNYIEDKIIRAAVEHLDISLPDKPEHFFNEVHQHVTPEDLNPFRMHIINAINQEPQLRSAYYSLARDAINTIVGNELTMQRRINLSIQMPQDDSSLLEPHADVWSGDSPYEVVLWVPLVDCYATKAMYLLDIEKDSVVQKNMGQFQNATTDALYEHISDKVNYIKIQRGQALLFCQNIIHGNRINEEAETRWSMNCRFKGLQTPYHSKEHAEFFEPISIKPATRFGMEYQFPEFDDE